MDSLVAEFTQILKKDEDGEAVKATGTLIISSIKTKKEAKKFIGLKQGDKVSFNPAKALGSDELAANLLQIEDKGSAAIKSDFEMEVTLVQNLEMAEMNQDLFDKIYGEGIITSEEELRTKVKSDLEEMFIQDTERKFINDATEYVINKLDLQLPDAFLMRWLEMQSEELTAERVREEYENYSKGTKWQLIENKIAKDNDLKVEREEVVAKTKELITGQMAQYGQNVDDEELNGIAERVLGNEEEAKRVSDQIFEQKLKNYFFTAFKIQEKEVSFDEFKKLATK